MTKMQFRLLTWPLLLAALAAGPLQVSCAGGGDRSAGTVQAAPVCNASQLAQCNCPSNFSCCPTDGSCFQNDSDVQFTMCKNNAAPICAMTGSASEPVCNASQLTKCNCPSNFSCCPTDGSCFQNASDVQFTMCKDNTAATCAMSGSATGGGSTGGGSTGEAACNASQLAQCNCPSNFSCCPTDGSCFQNPSDVQFTMCKDNTAAACAMSGSTGGGSTGGGSTGGGSTGGGTAPSTRLRVTSNCAQPIWIAHSNNVTDTQNVQLNRGQSRDYQIPSGGLSAIRFWPKIGCDGSGHNCTMGDDGEGGGTPCPANGCQPPLDSKFEASFAAVGSTDQTWYNLSQVDGFTLSFKVQPFGSGAGQNGCVASDCSKLSLAGCPGSDNLSEGGAFPSLASEDLRVRDASGNVIACAAPCKKINYPAPYGLGESESVDPGLHMCCPTPIDPSTGQCTAANGCMTSDTCRNANDPRSVVHTSYVAALHQMCPSAYAFSYDDANGLHACPSDTSFEVTFCP